MGSREAEQARRKLARRRETIARLYEATSAQRLAGEGREAGEKNEVEPAQTHLADEVLREILEIDRAIDRIDRGTWGLCERCGQRIGRSRLRALPETRRCLDCRENR